VRAAVADLFEKNPAAAEALTSTAVTMLQASW
jgi:hypothetical protein